MLNRIFNALTSIGRDRKKSYADYYARQSKEHDHLSNAALLQAVDKDAMVALGNIEKVLGSLKHRSEFFLTREDLAENVGPVFSAILAKVENGDIDCHVRPSDEVFAYGAIKTQDIVDMLDDIFPPDQDNKTTIYAVEDEAVPIDHDFGDSKIGRLRQKFADSFPLRTPSTPVTYVSKESKREVDIRRMFILAIGYADTTDNGMKSAPLYIDTLEEREAFRKQHKRKRVYRGREY